MKYRFYSRQTGYPEAFESKHFQCEILYDIHNDTEFLVGKSGSEIIELLRNNFSVPRYLKRKIISIAKIYGSWYYYPDKTKITMLYCEDF